MGSEKSTSPAPDSREARNPEPLLAVNELFSAGAPENAGWTRVNPALSTYWRLILLLNTLIGLSLVLALWLFVSRTTDSRLASVVTPLSVSATMAVLVLIFIWLFVLIGRRVASIGYRLKNRELEVSSGIMFQRLVSVPFARMQLVEVTAGPIERLFGIAGVQLHTASASTNAKIPGLTPGSALSLRDSLNAFGEQAGL